jgi:hypothetical protein
MYELLLLMKSGREIVVGRAGTKDEAQVLANAAQQMMASRKVAAERNDVFVINFEGAVYFIEPTEVEGLSLFTLEGAEPLVMQPQDPNAQGEAAGQASLQ